MISKPEEYIAYLTQAIDELKLSNQQLLERDSIKSQLISTISHELRTPMANILGFSELLLHKEYDSKTQGQYLGEIHNSALRLSNLIHNFLDLSRLENCGQLQLHNIDQVEIDWLAERAWSNLGAINQQHNIHWDFANDLPEIVVDSEAITRVFINIFANAIKYSPKSSAISCTIEYNPRNQEILVRVIDKGLGIAESDLNLVFEKFYRVENPEMRHISGTGLGLWICKEIIQAHGGRIWCESKLGEGSCFNFTLPVGIRNNENKNLLN